MFKTNYIKKIMNYNWSTLFNDTLPCDKKGVMENSETDSVVIGSALKIITITLISAIIKYIMFSLMNTNIWEILKFDVMNIGTIGSSVYLGIFILVYTLIFKDKEEIYYIRYGIGVLMLIDALSTILSGCFYLSLIFINPFLVLILIMLEIINMYGTLMVFSGSVDFCLRVKDDKNKNIESNECSKCQKKLRKTDKYCSNCGTKV